MFTKEYIANEEILQKMKVQKNLKNQKKKQKGNTAGSFI